MIVADASAIIEVLLRTPAAASIESIIFAADRSLHAPHLLDVEVAQVLRRFVLTGEMTADRGGVALERLAEFPLHRYPHGMYMARVWSLRNNMSAYDATYVALAMTIEATLVTRDRRLATTAGPLVHVELV